MAKKGLQMNDENQVLKTWGQWSTETHTTQKVFQLLT
jgi:hypothetical protein